MAEQWLCENIPIVRGYQWIHRVSNIAIITPNSTINWTRPWEVTMTVRAPVGFPVSWPSINAAVHRRHLTSLFSDWNMWESVKIVYSPVKVTYSGPRLFALNRTYSSSVVSIMYERTFALLTYFQPQNTPTPLKLSLGIWEMKQYAFHLFTVV